MSTEKEHNPNEPAQWEREKMAAEEQALWNRIERSYVQPRGRVRVVNKFEVTDD